MEYSELEKIRLEKIHHMRSLGIEPYPTRAGVTHTVAEAVQALVSAETAGSTEPVQVTCGGRLRAMRLMGKIIFAHFEDTTGRLQLFLRLNELGDEGMQRFRMDSAATEPLVTRCF